jgi:hypothetical protein
MEPSRTLVWWKVRCLNRQHKTFFDRYLVLDWSNLMPEQQAHVLALVEESSSKPEIVQYRRAFREVDQEELGRLYPQAQRTRNVFLPDYFEDEDGQPMGEMGLVQELTGQEYPILLGNPLSVLRLGPTAIRKKEEWSVKVANEIDHFLQTIRQIAGSNWLKSPLSLQFVAQSGNLKEFPGINRIISFDSPDGEATRGVLMSIRLLISSDDEFNIACNWYLKHVGDERKRAWAKEHKRIFNERRQSPPAPLAIGTYTTQQLIDTFIYGSGLVHRNSDKGCEAELARAVEEYGREQFVMAFNFACRDVCRSPFYVYHVIKQDYEHWTGPEGCQGPNRIDINALLG